MATKPPLGQHYLTDPHLLSQIVAAADLQADQLVLEIGAGLGSLTTELLRTGAIVWALEYDRAVYKQLSQRLAPQRRLRLLQTDIRRFNWQQLPADYKICANIPYYLTAYLLRQLTETDRPPTLAVLLVPEAVAKRLAAKERRSLLALIVQSSYEVFLGRRIRAGAFQPPPKIDSRLLSLRRRPLWPAITSADRPRWHAFLRAAFSSPRKQIGTNLRRQWHLTPAAYRQLGEASGCDLRLRPEALNNQQWQALWQASQPYLSQYFSLNAK